MRNDPVTVLAQEPATATCVPSGVDIGRVVHLGKLPVRFLTGAHRNLDQPDNTANWEVRAQVQLMFPK